MDKSMYLPNHPCYGIDICHAYSQKDMDTLRGQGYMTWTEFVELANRADNLETQVAQMRDAIETALEYPQYKALEYKLQAALDAAS